MRVGVICSAHGFGHLGRQLATIEVLIADGHDVVLIAAAPALLEVPKPVEVIVRRVDVGIVQSDSITENPERTREAWIAAAARVDELVEDLRGLDCAVVDIAPTALEACRRAGVPALAVGNFDWAWIYERYAALAEFAPRMREWQSAHPALALSPGPGLTGFSSVREVLSPLARRLPRRSARSAGEAPNTSVLVAFGGLGLTDLAERLPRIGGVHWIVTPPQERLEREDVRFVDDVAFPELLATADCVLTKPGYGVLAEAQLAGARLCWVDRGQFPEAPFLEAAMHARGDVKVDHRGIAEAVRRALAGPKPAAVRLSAARTVASRVLALR